MQLTTPHTPQTHWWSTSAFGEAPRPSPEELAQLAAHVKECRRARGRFFFLRSRAKTLNEVFATRFWTATFAVATLLLLASLVFRF